MTSIELVGFSALWLVAVSLIALLVLLYRQVERGYRRSAAMQALGIPIGNNLPGLEVISGEGTEILDFGPSADALTVLAFVTSTCSSCRRLVGDLQDGIDRDVRAVVAVNGETTDELRQAAETVEVRWMANPGDAIRDFGVMLVPLVYVAHHGIVLASGPVASGGEVTSLIDRARAEMAHDGSPVTVQSPVAIGGSR